MKLTLKAREQVWRKTVQRRRREEKRANANPHLKHEVRQEIREARRRAERALARVRAQIKDRRLLRERALDVARSLVGVMEHGGNNMGPKVTEIIRANGGTGPEPWCGDFVAYCYRGAGSKSVTRSWASVYFLGRIAGVVQTNSPQAGDIVRYSFGHTGLFVRWLSGGNFEAIEGNTGASGAVSDSSTGGDGVYLKRRNRSQVTDFRHVTR